MLSTHIFLQNFVLIQPRTSPPKNDKKLQKYAAMLVTQVTGAHEADGGEGRGGRRHPRGRAAARRGLARRLDP